MTIYQKREFPFLQVSILTHLARWALPSRAVSSSPPQETCHSRKPPPCHSRKFLAGIQQFIPALAGNIWCRLIKLSIMAVHPRARGEHLKRKGRLKMNCGSSPRSRGTFCQLFAGVIHHRFIPALAGNMVIDLVGVDLSAGSSPRSRGT